MNTDDIPTPISDRYSKFEAVPVMMRRLERALHIAEDALKGLAECEVDCSSGCGGYTLGRATGDETPCNKCVALETIQTLKGKV